MVRPDTGAVEEGHPGLDPAAPLRRLQQPLPGPQARHQRLKVCAAIHHGPSCLGQVPLAVHVLDQDHLARADDARLAVAGRDLVGAVEVDHVLPPRRGVPVEALERFAG